MPFVKKTPQSSNPLLEAINEINRVDAKNSATGIAPVNRIVDIMTFCDDPKYLNLPGVNLRMYMSQKVILKAFYMGTRGNENLKLDKEEWEWLYKQAKPEERDGYVFQKNIDQVIEKLLRKEKTGFNFSELHLVMGRRASKCREENDIIATTEGSITFGELNNRLNSGEKIGICTYDPDTFKRSVTYDIKSQHNGIVDCFRVETKRGLVETSSWNHPYLIWRKEWDSPRFIQMSQLLPGDRIAVAECTELFGKGGVGVNKAALLGHLQGDGSTIYSVRYTTASSVMLEDMKRIVRDEFPDYVVKYQSKYDYTIAKKSGRFKQNGSQKNEIKEWLIQQECYGKKSKDKEVPDCILRGSKEEVAAFLSRLYGCDGWATTAKKVTTGHGGVPGSSIGYCSASRKFIDGIRHLLQKFGIHATVSFANVKCNGKTFDSWKLVIKRKECMEIFEKEINIFSKEDAVKKAIVASGLRDESNSEFNGLPIGIWNYIANVKVIKNLSDADILGRHGCGHNDRLRRQYSPCRNKMLLYGESIGDKFLTDMGVANIRWDEIKSVTSVDKKQTIAIEVKGTNIIGGDIVSHNTVIASIITAYEAYKLLVIGDGNPHKFYNLPYDDQIAIINVALSQKQASILFGQVQARLRNSPFFKDHLANETTTEIRLYTDADLEKKSKGSVTGMSVPGSILILCGHSNPDTLRGMSTILILFDELAFYDESGKVTGKYFYDTLKPSRAHFMKYGDGRLVEISSPSGETGIFYDIFKESKTDDKILSFQLPTWDANPTVPYEHEDLVKERNNNMDSFAVEFGAQWARGGICGSYFPEGLIIRCIRTDISEHIRPLPGFNYYLHVDPANGGDRYVYVLVAKQYYKNFMGVRRSRVLLAKTKIYLPVSGMGLQFNLIDKDVIELCGQFHPLAVSYDSWNSIQSLQLLRSHGIHTIQTSYNRNFKNKIYQNLKDMMGYPEDPELWLYDEPQLISEMKALKFRPTMRGISLVVDKHGDVKTDDLVDCLAGAAAMASENIRAPLPMPVVVATGWR